jgi:hypothetical protein
VINAAPGATLTCGDERLPPESDHIGVWVATGLGDGQYPVYADMLDLPGGGLRVARIVIDCLGTEPQRQSDDLRSELTDVLSGPAGCRDGRCRAPVRRGSDRGRGATTSRDRRRWR